MATPDFVLDLRRHIGTRPLPLVGVTAVIFRDEKVLLGRRSDNGALTPITGIVDPGEEPADAPCLELYLNDCRSLPPAEWLTEILLPLQR